MNMLEQKVFQEMETTKDMIARGDHIAAREKLKTLQNQFASLDEINRMITVCDILHSASFDLLDGLTDWYWVLQVPPTASEQHLKSQYDKLFTTLKPIKNHFPAAESALRIVQEAYAVLSSPEKCSSFHRKRASKFGTFELQKIHAVDSRHNYLLAEGEGIVQCDSSAYEIFKAEASFGHIQIEEKDSKAPQQAGDVEMEISCEASGSSSSFFSLEGCYEGHCKFNGIKTPNIFEVGQIWTAYDDECMPRNYVQIYHIDRNPVRLHVSSLKPAPLSAYEVFWCGMGFPIVCGLFIVDRNERKIVVPDVLSHMVCSDASEEVEIRPQEHEIWAMYREWDPSIWCSDPEAWKKSQLDLVKIITGYTESRNMIAARLIKVEGFKNVFGRYTKNGLEQLLSIPSTNLAKFSHKIPACKFVGEMDGMFELDPYAVPSVRSILGVELFVSESKWSTKDFACNQVWAVRDERDNMPRRYVLVKNVAPEGQVFVTMLEANPILADEKHWVQQELPFSSGLFKAGKTTAKLGVSQFSHMVNWKQSEYNFSSCYKIYPKNGEVWAMYKNWNCEWKQLDFARCQYRIVEIVADFQDESEVLVADLVEVPGYTTFFQRKVSNKFELILRGEFLCFSHRIVAFHVEGKEASGISKDCWHLEPDDLPPNCHTSLQEP